LLGGLPVGTPVAFEAAFEVYLVVGQIVVRAAMVENLLLELCTAVRVDRNVTSAAAQAARQTWRKPRTELIGLILESLDQIPPEDRFDFTLDMHYARDALMERHVIAHTAWPFAMTDLGMVG
jgi:hypothetical protein